LTFPVCPSHRYLCHFAENAIEVFEILVADWYQTRAALPLSEKQQNCSGLLVDAGADFLFFSKTINAKSGFMNADISKSRGYIIISFTR
jgi:hypothetical protein